MLTTQQNIIEGIYSYLNGSVGSDNPSGQLVTVYELQPPQDEPLPVCIFNIITDDVESMLNCEVAEINLQVDFYGEREAGSKALRTISDTLFNDLKRDSLTIDDSNVSNTVTGTKNGTLTVEGDDFFRITQEYIIKIQ